jgi:hypothetical protein
MVSPKHRGLRMTDEDRGTMNIRLVDDDATMRAMLVNYLEEHDIGATPASGRQELARHLAEGGRGSSSSTFA